MNNSKKLLMLVMFLASTSTFLGCNSAKPKPARVTLIIQDEQDFLFIPKGTRMTNPTTGLDLAVNTNGFFISTPYAAKVLDGVKLDQIGGDD